MDRKNVIVMTPTGMRSVDLAIAGSRAGAIACLNLEAVASVAEARQMLLRFATFGRSRAMLRFGLRQWSIVQELWPEIERFVEPCLLLDPTDGGWDVPVEWLRARGKPIWLQMVEAREFPLAIQWQVAAVVLKGNESGGQVGEATAFVLTQQWVAYQRSLGEIPFWVQGGVGEHSAAACLVAGATGVVLDAQLLLAHESPLSGSERQIVGRMDGGQTQTIGDRLADRWRIYVAPGTAILDDLTTLEERLQPQHNSASACDDEWRTAIRHRLANQPWAQLSYVGQDAAFAHSLSERYRTVGGIIQGICETATADIMTAKESLPFQSDRRMALSHGTKYPILQGPMTRVSDTPEFAEAVAVGGGLPFLALALMREPEARQVLQATKDKLGDRPWGVGLLGFLPPDIRAEQTRAVTDLRPPFAIIAGGRPDQSRELEELGITTYLHVPSPGLLRMFLRDGARRFIFEGRECGGHVGPRGSFVLWESMVVEILDRLRSEPKIANDLHVVFAGGIHDGLSAAMAMALSAPLLRMGARVGVLMGTAYLATHEAVSSGAIVLRFQQEVLQAKKTVLFATGPGHAVRCLETPYYDEFEAERRRLRTEGKSNDEITRALEMNNIGRLRIASKGLDRSANTGGLRQLEAVDEQTQFRRGMYMVGQAATLRNSTIALNELHQAVAVGGAKSLDAAAERLAIDPAKSDLPRCDIAIIGMACHYPGAVGLRPYWENILQKKQAVQEIPASHWDWRLYYDPNPLAADRIVSKWGGFLDDIPFDPVRYGITPKSVSSIEPLQLLLLETVRAALTDAGYEHREFARERTAAILGVGGGGSPLAVAYGFRACMPLLDHVDDVPVKAETIIDLCADRLPQWTEDSFPGFLLNVAVGRVANRFNLGGSNYAIDAACASSLAAVHACVRELESGTADVAIAMGADTVQTPYAYMAFSKTHALSPQGRCRPFDAAADGIVLSEGLGAVILKRLADAERDGDRIYGVIRGVGSSSDGKDKGLTAPNSIGQRRALQRAYEKAGISPATVGLIEAHGTGTVVGDRTEAEALAMTLRESGAEPQSCALGSVKSMIGHTKCAAGIAGLIKSSLALYHKVLPPTLVDTPNSKANFRESALYLNTTPMPWLHAEAWPRRAGVSAFGFGGTNVHVAMEEYTGDYLDRNPVSSMQEWPTEIYLWRQQSVTLLLQGVRQLLTGLRQGAAPRPVDLAVSLWNEISADAKHPTLAIVATSREHLIELLTIAEQALAAGNTEISDPRGIWFIAAPPFVSGQLAVLFPGQGAQYCNMGAELALAFPVVQQTLESGIKSLACADARRLARVLYPPSWFTDEEKNAAEQQLARTDMAQPAVGLVSLAMWELWRDSGLSVDMVAGHSYGEYTALCAAGVLTPDDFLKLSSRRGEILHAISGSAGGAMLAVMASADTMQSIVADLPRLCIANFNAPQQLVVSGPTDDVMELIRRCNEHQIKSQRLTVACAFHSPAMRPARQPFVQTLDLVSWSESSIPVYSNTTAARHTNGPKAIRESLADHLTAPVRFAEEVERMYQDGARIFLEIGPQRQLSGLVERILQGREHVTICTDVAHKSGITQWQQAAARLMTLGVPLNLAIAFQNRNATIMPLEQLCSFTNVPKYGPTTYLVNGTRAKLWNAPEPKLLGQSPTWQTKSVESNPVEAIATSASETTLAAQPSPALHRITTPSARITMNNPPPPPVSSPLATATSAPATPTSAPTFPPASPAATPSSTNGHADNRKSYSNATPSSLLNQSQTHGPSGSPMSIPSHGDIESVMLSFQQVMAKFLETEREVMLHYLNPNVVKSVVGAAPVSPAPAVASFATASPQDHTRNVPPSSSVSTSPRMSVEPSTPSAPVIQTEPAQRPTVHVAVADGPSMAVTGESTTFGNVPSAPPSNGAAKKPTLQTIREVEDKLLALVSDRTGYPPEMLGAEMDLEADLGIDSIKRVEILGDLAESLGIGTDAESSLDLEKLTTLRNLKGILEYLENLLFSTAAPVSRQSDPRLSATHLGPSITSNVKPSPNGDRPPGAGTVAIQRGLVELVDIAWPGSGQISLPAGGVILTDDTRGIAAAIATRLAAFDIPAVIVRHVPNAVLSDERTCLVVDCSNPVGVASLIEKLRSVWGTIGGIMHLAPLAPLDDAEWEHRALHDLRSLYLLARACETDLKTASQNGNALFLATTGMGGSLGYAPSIIGPQILAGHGGVLGFTKCLAMEWEKVRVRAVDLDSTEDVELIADRLLSELADANAPVEIGHFGQQRVTWQPVSAPIDHLPTAAIELDEHSTILVTGGARGITAAIALELGRRFQPRLILVGRSALPSEAEAADTAMLREAAAIKAALIERARQQGRKASPGEIQVQYGQLMRDREVRDNLRALRQTGATVEYHSLDVTDRDALAELIATVQSHYGPLTGVIHGAGVIDDKLVRDKTPESLDRVFRTKVESAANICRLIDASEIKFCAFFSSIASRYGNRGQADYAAANEVLSKLACELDRRWSARVFAVAWGPWAEIGMVADLERHLVARGVSLIPPAVGVQFFLDELLHGSKGDCEVLIAGGAEHLVTPTEGLVTPTESVVP